MKILMVILIVLVFAVVLGLSVAIAFTWVVRFHENDGCDIPIDFRNDDIFMYVEDDD